MAKKISDYVAAAALDGTELMEFVQAGANKKGANGAILPPGYIDGLNLQWVSATALTVTSGAAYIPSLGRLVRANASIAKVGLALTASTWYHVYLWLNGANADVEIVTTAPSAAYNGTARAKMGDQSRRYLGSVVTDASGAIYQFVQIGMTTRYFTGGGAPFRALTNGMNTVRTNIDISSWVPVSSVSAIVKAQNSSSGAQALIVDSAASGLTGTAGFFIIAQPGTQLIADVPTFGTPTLVYEWGSAPVTQGAFLDILGFTISR